MVLVCFAPASCVWLGAVVILVLLGALGVGLLP
jgi:hypothetical protein